MSRRTEMLGSTIQRELAVMILHDLDDPRITGFPSITRVEVSADLSQADVFVTIMGTPGAQTAALNALKHSAGMMRTKLTKSLTLRVAPFIKFHIDEQLKKELNVLQLLEKVSKEDAERQARLNPTEPATPVETSDAPAGASPTGVSTDASTKTQE